MCKLHEMATADLRFCSLPGFQLDPTLIERQSPDAFLLATDDDHSPLGRCSLWWKSTPSLMSWRVGFIGHFAVTSHEAASTLLERACERLTREGCEVAIGPVDGNTWQRYRLLTERGTEPIYFMEPDNPDDWPGLFLAAGFTSIASYASALNSDLAATDPRLPAFAQRVHELGIEIRSLDLMRFEEELRRVHALSLVSFRDNFLYSSIDEATFLAQYRALLPYVRPELALLAEQKGELIGFLFAIPDLLQAKRGEAINTVILKTLAVHPERSGLGLGSLLMGRLHEVSKEIGFTRAIHALFHEANRSGRISSRSARVFRRYTLYGRFLN